MNATTTIETNPKTTHHRTSAASFAAELSLDELAAVRGGDVEPTWDNSSDYRDGLVQVVGAAGGLVATGIAITTAPLWFPLAVGAAAVAGGIAGFVAADGWLDMENAAPDAHSPPPEPEEQSLEDRLAGYAEDSYS